MVIKKRIHYSCEGGIEKNRSLAITNCHHSTSLVMPIGDPRDGFFYPTFTLMIDSYIVHVNFQYSIFATEQAIGTASANSAKFRGIRPRMYIEDLL